MTRRPAGMAVVVSALLLSAASVLAQPADAPAPRAAAPTEAAPTEAAPSQAAPPETVPPETTPVDLPPTKPPPSAPAMTQSEAAKSALGAEHCGANWFSRVYAATYRSVVRIDTGRGALGAGFLFDSPMHVATAYHVVAFESVIVVTLADERRIAATLVAVDEDNDLALLALAEPAADHPPLQLHAGGEIERGTPVLAIGHPYAVVDDELESVLTWSVSQGIVSGVGDRLLQTDAALNPGNSGGPLIDCEGRVLGIVSAKLRGEGIGFVIPAALLQSLFGRIGEPLPTRVEWDFGLSLGGMLHATDDDGMLGFNIGAGVSFFERWELRLSGGAVYTIYQPELEPGLFSRSRSRTVGQLDGGYRMSWRPLPFSLGLHLGVAVGNTETEETRLTARPQDPNCSGSGCALVVDRLDGETNLWMGWPVIGADIRLLGVVGVSYSFMPDVTDIASSTHRGVISLEL